MKRFNILIFFLISFVLVSCEKDDNGGGKKTGVSRTVLMYIAADNNLWDYAQTNIQDLAEGMSLSQYDGNLIVYQDIQGSKPRLVKMEPDGSITLLEEYAAENSASPAVLRRVIDETVRRYPADSYGLVLSSHGIGWIPKTASFAGKAQAAASRHLNPDAPMTKWFGQDDSAHSYMDISEIASALPKNRFFDFILFDACFMGNVETVYELRDNAEYIIGSPAEVIATGFPYKSIVPIFFDPNQTLDKVCKSFMDFYRNYTHKAATVSLVKTSELEALAETVRLIVAPSLNTWSNVQGLQAFEGLTSHLFYDLGDYLKSLDKEGSAYKKFTEQLGRTVIYGDHTPSAYSAYCGCWYDITAYSGLTTYIPRVFFTDYNEAYPKTAWGEAIGY